MELVRSKYKTWMPHIDMACHHLPVSLMHARREKEREREREREEKREKRKDEGEGGRPGQREQSRKKKTHGQVSAAPSSCGRCPASKRTRKQGKKTRTGPESRKGEEEGRRGEKKRKADPKKTPRNPLHPKTLRQSLPNRSKTIRLDNKNNSPKMLQHISRAHSQKPSEQKPSEK